MIRWHRMQGDPTLWLPGADHAGIAGQWVVEKRTGRGRADPPRPRPREVPRARLGLHGPLPRPHPRAVAHPRRLVRLDRASPSRWTPARRAPCARVFKRLYDKGLIYRGERLINWCPRCMTALSDLEVDPRGGAAGPSGHLRYPIEGSGRRSITVATTRPETMLGDTAVAVHPGRRALPAPRSARWFVCRSSDRLIPIVADDAVDPAFGTGAVKVTPAHDPNDFEIGQRHHLPAINVMNLDGTMNDEGRPVRGADDR